MVGHSSNLTGVLREEERQRTLTHRQMPLEEKSTGGELPASPRDRPEADPATTALRGSPPCLHLGLGLSAFRTGRM